jgi:uncharacterized protein DUF4190
MSTPDPRYGQQPQYPPAQYPQYGQQPPYGYYPQPGYYVYPAPKTNGLAIASLVLGLVPIAGIGSILAIIFGCVALGQIKERGDGGHGLAVAGIVLGSIFLAVIVIAVIAVIASS